MISYLMMMYISGLFSLKLVIPSFDGR